jgi:hypothetical protein
MGRRQSGDKRRVVFVVQESYQYPISLVDNPHKQGE